MQDVLDFKNCVLKNRALLWKSRIDELISKYESSDTAFWNALKDLNETIKEREPVPKDAGMWESYYKDVFGDHNEQTLG